MRSRLPAALLCVAALACSGCPPRAPAGNAAPSAQAQPVRAAAAVRKSVPLRLHTFGTVVPILTVQIKALVAGQLLSVNVE